jgi:hypothetical protein
MEFFSNQTLIQSVVGTTNWQSPYFDMRNYCLYCDHPTSTEFQQAIRTNNSVPYFWRHESLVCKQNPALLWTLYMPYFDRLKSSNLLLRTLSPDELDDFLFFTELRTNTSSFIGEKDRSDIFYVCMFLDSKIYGFVGDNWEISVFPVRYRGAWILDILLRAILLFSIVVFIWIPRIKYWIIGIPKFKNAPPKSLVLIACSSLQTQALICATLSLLTGFFEDFMFLQTTAPGYRALNGIFSLISCVFVYLGSFLVLLLWANIAQATSNMNISTILSKTYLITLAAVYCFTALIVLSGIIIRCTASTDQTNVATSALIFISVIIYFMVMVGFSVYGVKILWMFRFGRTKAELMQLRVTRLIFLINLSGVLVIAFLIITAITGLAPNSVNQFFVVYNGRMQDWAAFVMIATQMIFLFRYDLFVDCYRRALCKNSSKAEPAIEPATEQASETAVEA